jgi:hypothetical protein
MWLFEGSGTVWAPYGFPLEWLFKGINLNGWNVHVDHLYFVWAVVLTLVIRLGMSFHNAWGYWYSKRKKDLGVGQISYCEAFKRFFLGVNPDDVDRSDYWLPTFLGFLELLSYPVLLKIELWSVIGAWIGFKTVAQWRVWSESRTQFNLYLAGNALAIMASVLVLLPLVKATRTDQIQIASSSASFLHCWQPQ